MKGPGIVIAGSDVSVLLKKGEFTVGVGCRKGVKTRSNRCHTKSTCGSRGGKHDVLVYATTQKKSGEKGLLQAISALSGNLIFLDDDTINAQSGVTPSRATKSGSWVLPNHLPLPWQKEKSLL